MGHKPENAVLTLHDLKRAIAETPGLWGTPATKKSISEITGQSEDWCIRAAHTLAIGGFISPAIPSKIFTNMDRAWYETLTSSLCALEGIAANRAANADVGTYLEDLHNTIQQMRQAARRLDVKATRVLASELLSLPFDIAGLPDLKLKRGQLSSEAYLYAWARQGSPAQLDEILIACEAFAQALIAGDASAGTLATDIRSMSVNATTQTTPTFKRGRLRDQAAI